MLPHSSSRAFTVNIVANDFLVITQLNKLCRSINIADMIALLGSLDFVLGSVDLNRESLLIVIIFFGHPKG
jgi:NADH:ubiquinone oxidoreductase subunit D